MIFEVSATPKTSTTISKAKKVLLVLALDGTGGIRDLEKGVTLNLNQEIFFVSSTFLCWRHSRLQGVLFLHSLLRCLHFSISFRTSSIFVSAKETNRVRAFVRPRDFWFIGLLDDQIRIDLSIEKIQTQEIRIGHGNELPNKWMTHF